MNTKRFLKLAAAFALVTIVPAAGSAEIREMPMQGGMGQHGAMGQSQHGMMSQHHGMMGCPMMSGGMRSGMMMGRGVPALPPGNEKLQLQMQAEIMQKVGEIMAKYANQIQTR